MAEIRHRAGLKGARAVGPGQTSGVGRYRSTGLSGSVGLLRAEGILALSLCCYRRIFKAGANFKGSEDLTLSEEPAL